MEQKEIKEIILAEPGPKEVEEKTMPKSLQEICNMASHIQKTAKIYTFNNNILLVPIFDPHIGLKATNMEKLCETIDFILRTPNCYTILGGDFLECATKTSVGLAMYEENLSVKDQFLTAFKLLKPLADAGKILGTLTGNHEMRLANFADINPMELLADQLGVPYFKYQGFIILKIKDQTYKVAFSHGVSSSTTPAGAMASMRKQASVIECDIYFSGHIHIRKQDSDIYNIVNVETGNIEKRTRKYMICGSFVEYWESYAEMKMYSPSDTGTVSVLFNADKWAMETCIPE